MALSAPQRRTRLCNRENEKRKLKPSQRRFNLKKRLSRRLLSRKEREGIIEICLAFALGLRETYLRDMIEKLGGLAKPHLWPEKNVKHIRYLRYELNKTRRQLYGLKSERRQFRRARGKGNFYADYSTYFAAKHLGVHVVVVLRVCRRFATTGSVLFRGDLRLNKNHGVQSDRANREQPNTHGVATKATTVKVETSLPCEHHDIYHRDTVDESDYPVFKEKTNASKRKVQPKRKNSLPRLSGKERKRLLANEKFYESFSLFAIFSLEF